MLEHCCFDADSADVNCCTDIFTLQLIDAVKRAQPEDISWLQLPAVKKMFTLGDCHYLAGALHQATGWQLRAMLNRSGNADLHAFVVTDDLHAFDVEGLHDIEQLRKRYFAFGHTVVEPKQFSNWGCHRGPGLRNEEYDEQARWLADRTAQALLVRHGFRTNVQADCSFAA